MSDTFSRGDFVKVVGSIGAAGALPAAADAAQKAPEAHAATPANPSHAPAAPHMAMPAKPLGNEPEAYTYFTAPEIAFVEAAVERLIPNDHLGAGAKEAGVAFYIDQQLDGQFGYGAKMYRQGPWPPAQPTQGYQLPHTPRDVYRLGIAATNAYCTQHYGKTFDQLTGAQQDEVLSALEGSKVHFDAVPAKTFFEMLYMNTTEGYFADPIYGGNRDKVGWKLLGFPGVAAAYTAYIPKHNQPYRVNPIGIGDIQHAQTAESSNHMEMLARMQLEEER